MKNNETRQQLSVSTGTISSSKYQICDNQNILHYYPGQQQQLYLICLQTDIEFLAADIKPN